MKKDGNLSQALVLILIFPVAILTVLFLLLYTPIDFFRYCFSNRRKEMKRLYGKRAKYFWMITLTDDYKIFELIVKNNLPISFIPACENPCAFGYFYYNRTLFLMTVAPHFDSESGNWYFVNGDDGSDFVSYVESEKEAFHRCTGFNETVKCERVVFLVKEKDVYAAERDLVENADFILVYNKQNFAAQMSKFIEK